MSIALSPEIRANISSSGVGADGRLPIGPTRLRHAVRSLQKRDYLTFVAIWLSALLTFFELVVAARARYRMVRFILSIVALAWLTLIPLHFIFIVLRGGVPSSRVAVPADCGVAWW